MYEVVGHDKLPRTNRSVTKWSSEVKVCPHSYHRECDNVEHPLLYAHSSVMSSGTSSVENENIIEQACESTSVWSSIPSSDLGIS